MKYLPLKEPCKSAIEKGICLGCNRLELPEFQGLPGCKGSKEQKNFREILGEQEKMKL